MVIMYSTYSAHFVSFYTWEYMKKKIKLYSPDTEDGAACTFG